MISSIYLLKRGVDINKKDIYGNSPLGCALLFDHPNYAVVLMQNNCDIQNMLFEPDSSKLKIGKEGVKKSNDDMEVDKEEKKVVPKGGKVETWKYQQQEDEEIVDKEINEDDDEDENDEDEDEYFSEDSEANVANN